MYTNIFADETIRFIKDEFEKQMITQIVLHKLKMD